MSSPGATNDKGAMPTWGLVAIVIAVSLTLCCGGGLALWQFLAP